MSRRSVLWLLANPLGSRGSLWLAIHDSKVFLSPDEDKDRLVLMLLRVPEAIRKSVGLMSFKSSDLTEGSED